MRLVTEILHMEQRTSPGKRKLRIRKGRLIFAAIMIVLMCASLWSISDILRSFIFSQIAEVDVLREGVAKQTQTVKGLLIKKEYLVVTPYKGTVKYSVADGHRVKGGTTIATVTVPNMENSAGTTNYAIKAPVSGVLSRHIDGWETVLVPDTLDVVKLPTLDKIESNDQPVTTGVVDKGQPVAKIIDNLTTLYVYATLNPAEIKKMQSQRLSFINVEWQNQPLEAKVQKVLSGSQPAIILAIENYPDELLDQRWVDFKLTTDTKEGLLIPETSLVRQKGQTGIFQVWKGIVRWVPVQVTGSLNGQVVITGKDIQPGIRYVVNPTLAREGDRL